MIVVSKVATGDMQDNTSCQQHHREHDRSRVETNLASQRENERERSERDRRDKRDREDVCECCCQIGRNHGEQERLHPERERGARFERRLHQVKRKIHQGRVDDEMIGQLQRRQRHAETKPPDLADVKRRACDEHRQQDRRFNVQVSDKCVDERGQDGRVCQHKSERSRQSAHGQFRQTAAQGFLGKPPQRPLLIAAKYQKRPNYSSFSRTYKGGSARGLLPAGNTDRPAWAFCWLLSALPRLALCSTTRVRC